MGYNLYSFVGKVRYEDTETLMSMLNDEKRMSGKVFDKTGWGQASTFFFKRVAFQHEEEVRILLNTQKNNHLDTYKLNINPFDIFDEIVLDPRLNDKMFQERKRKIIEWGFNKEVTQSDLYKIEKFTIALRPLED